MKRLREADRWIRYVTAPLFLFVAFQSSTAPNGIWLNLVNVVLWSWLGLQAAYEQGKRAQKELQTPKKAAPYHPQKEG